MRAGGFLFYVWRLKGFTVGYPIIVMIYRSNPLVECMPLYGLRNAKSYACNPPQFDLKKLFQKNLKKGLTKRGFCYILNKSSAMSHQKRQQLNKMESWLSGRRRTIGNRVGVMSVSRVQIPDSPPVNSKAGLRACFVFTPRGGVAEWLNAAVSKTVWPV